MLLSLEEHREAIEDMTAVLLDVEVIDGKKVQDIIIAHGGTLAESEENNDDLKDDKIDKDKKVEE